MFETVTAASPWEISGARRSQLVGGAFLLHAAFAVAYLVVTLWSIPEVAPPKLFDVFVPESVPPQVTFVATPPSRPAEGDRSSAPANDPPSISSEPRVRQPESVAILEPALPGSEELLSVSGPLLSVGGGTDVAVEPGFGGGGGDETLVYDARMSPPRVLHRVEPLFPELARKMRRQGTVILEAEIGRDGVLRSARAINAPLGFGLEEAALKALASWRFAPAELQGQPVSVYYRLSVNFRLQ
jgi:protein TonB